MSSKAVTESDPSANWGHFSSSAFQCLERSVAESDDWKSAAQLQNSHLADPIQQLENYIDAASATLKIAVAQHLELHSLLSQIDQFPRTPRSCVTPPATGLYHASTPSPTRKEPLPSTTCLTQLYAPEQRSPKPCTDHYTEENNDIGIALRARQPERLVCRSKSVAAPRTTRKPSTLSSSCCRT